VEGPRAFITATKRRFCDESSDITCSQEQSALRELGRTARYERKTLGSFLSDRLFCSSTACAVFGKTSLAQFLVTN
jgi:hypothetical protein